MREKNNKTPKKKCDYFAGIMCCTKKEEDSNEISLNNSVDMPKSLFNGEINQKGIRKPDKSIPVIDLSTDNLNLIEKHYLALLQNKPANYSYNK